MIDSTTLLLVHYSDEFFDLKFSALEILIIKFKSYESVTKGGVSVIDLNDVFGVFIMLLEKVGVSNI